LTSVNVPTVSVTYSEVLLLLQ